MTKKMILITMVAILMLTIVGCGKKEEKENNESDSSKESYVENDNVTQAPTIAPTIEPTEKPTQEPTIEPTIEPTEKPTQAPTTEPTEKPTQAPTVEPTIEPTKKPTQAPTQKPVVTAKPTKTPSPTKAPAKTYWYSWIEDGVAERQVESELPPDKYPLPDGYARWTGPEHWEDFGDVWIGELKDNELAYNADGTPNLKEAVVYCADEEFAKYILESKEFKAYFKEKGIANVKQFEAWMFLELDSRSPNSFEYSFKNGDDPKGDFIYVYLDKNYKVVEENPYE